MASSHGKRSASVSGIPRCIFSLLPGEWNWSASRKTQPSRCARISAMVLFPEPATPITTTIIASPRIKRRAEFVAIKGKKSSEWRATNRPPLRQPVEHTVIRPGQRQRPGISAAQTNGRAMKCYFGEGVVISVAANHARQLCAHPCGGRHAMTRESNREMHSVDLSPMRHHVKREVQRASPDIFHLGVPKLRVHANHAFAQKLRALSHRVFRLPE